MIKTAATTLSAAVLKFGLRTKPSALLLAKALGVRKGSVLRATTIIVATESRTAPNRAIFILYPKFNFLVSAATNFV